VLEIFDSNTITGNKMNYNIGYGLYFDTSNSNSIMNNNMLFNILGDRSITGPQATFSQATIQHHKYYQTIINQINLKNEVQMNLLTPIFFYLFWRLLKLIIKIS